MIISCYDGDSQRFHFTLPSPGLFTVTQECDIQGCGYYCPCQCKRQFQMVTVITHDDASISSLFLFVCSGEFMHLFISLSAFFKKITKQEAPEYDTSHLALLRHCERTQLPRISVTHSLLGLFPLCKADKSNFYFICLLCGLNGTRESSQPQRVHECRPSLEKS